MPGTRRSNRARGGVTGPHPFAAGSATNSGAGETGAVHQGAILPTPAGGISGIAKTILGKHMWARGYFCATVGAVDQAMIKAYVESQKWAEDDQGFKITAPTEP